MAWSLKKKAIRCPNCNYVGPSQAKEQGCGLWIVLLVVCLLTPLFWPLLIVDAVMFVWLLSMPAKHSCPKCQFANPIPLTPEEAEQAVAPKESAPSKDGTGEILIENEQWTCRFCKEKVFKDAQACHDCGADRETAAVRR